MSSEPAAPGYTVKHVAALTGLSPDTVRMWERRYAVVSPSRSASGYRVYDEAAVQRLTAMRALVDGGCPPREAAARVTSGTTLGPVPAAGSPDPAAGDVPAAPAPGALTQAARALDAAALDAVLDQAFAAGPFEEVVDDWLMPQLALLGTAWRAGEVSVGGEHFVSAAVQRRVAAAYEAAVVLPGAPRVLVGLARGSRHEIGVLVFAAALRRAGVGVVYLGADVPPESWVVLVSGGPVAAVVLGVPTPEDEPAARETLAALGAAYPRLRLCVGGGRQDQLADLGSALGHRITDAVPELTRILFPSS
ncbi:MerR family transcriptional regulator [Nocardioides taihuensis]|uniref:MerR family transcriptional regulator n=1 Tax=Nocardioides taihuensis TaxID=1835606 RepID=A0ABW0BJ95_9ACTN